MPPVNLLHHQRSQCVWAFYKDEKLACISSFLSRSCCAISFYLAERWACCCCWSLPQIARPKNNVTLNRVSLAAKMPQQVLILDFQNSFLFWSQLDEIAAMPIISQTKCSFSFSLLGMNMTLSKVAGVQKGPDGKSQASWGSSYTMYVYLWGIYYCARWTFFFHFLHLLLIES